MGAGVAAGVEGEELESASGRRSGVEGDEEAARRDGGGGVDGRPVRAPSTALAAGVDPRPSLARSGARARSQAARVPHLPRTAAVRRRDGS